jgi:hypothetical protein
MEICSSYRAAERELWRQPGRTACQVGKEDQLIAKMPAMRQEHLRNKDGGVKAEVSR